jgi:hypothetical protein
MEHDHKFKGTCISRVFCLSENIGIAYRVLFLIALFPFSLLSNYPSPKKIAENAFKCIYSENLRAQIAKNIGIYISAKGRKQEGLFCTSRRGNFSKLGVQRRGEGGGRY